MKNEELKIVNSQEVNSETVRIGAPESHEKVCSRLHCSLFTLRKCKAFTLAEVLITLGVIGIVAALTMPTLIGNYRKKQTEVKLQKFYSLMSQTIQRWETDEGLDPEQVKFSGTINRPEEQGGWDIAGDFQTWYENNLSKYLISLDKSVKVQAVAGGAGESPRFTVKLADGSGFNGYIANEDLLFIFYCTEAKYCRPESYDGKNTFLFRMVNGSFKTGCPDYKNHDLLLSRVNSAVEEGKGRCQCCSSLIEIDGWQISKDYPIRF